MKVLFLDVDGVLNSYLTSTGFMPISKPMLRRLMRVLKATQARIVLSSTWRKLPESYRKINRALQYKGYIIYSKTTTEYFKERQVRGDEIQKWIDDHKFVGRYAIVDDDGDMLEHQKPFFVQTDGGIGLTDADADRLIKILNGE